MAFSSSHQSDSSNKNKGTVDSDSSIHSTNSKSKTNNKNHNSFSLFKVARRSSSNTISCGISNSNGSGRVHKRTSSDTDEQISHSSAATNSRRLVSDSHCTAPAAAGHIRRRGYNSLAAFPSYSSSSSSKSSHILLSGLSQTKKSKIAGTDNVTGSITVDSRKGVYCNDGQSNATIEQVRRLQQSMELPSFSPVENGESSADYNFNNRDHQNRRQNRQHQNRQQDENSIMDKDPLEFNSSASSSLIKEAHDINYSLPSNTDLIDHSPISSGLGGGGDAPVGHMGTSSSSTRNRRFGSSVPWRSARNSNQQQYVNIEVRDDDDDGDGDDRNDYNHHRDTGSSCNNGNEDYNGERHNPDCHQQQQRGKHSANRRSLSSLIRFGSTAKQPKRSNRIMLNNESQSSCNSSIFFRIKESRRRFGSFSKCILWYIRALWWSICYAIFPDRVSMKPRTVHLNGTTTPSFFPPNVIRNQRYNFLTLIPCVLFDQFRFFFNIFYLIVALSQFVPQLKVGPLFTYIAPLSLVLSVTISKEAYDDYQRKLRDHEANSAKIEVFDRLYRRSLFKAASELKVGDIMKLNTNQKVPADVILLRTSNQSGTTFIRTDQLDGETDWKLRRAVSATQSMSNLADVYAQNWRLQIEAPRPNIYEFIGAFHRPCAFDDSDIDRRFHKRPASKLSPLDDKSCRDLKITSSSCIDPEEVRFSAADVDENFPVNHLGRSDESTSGPDESAGTPDELAGGPVESRKLFEHRHSRIDSEVYNEPGCLSDPLGLENTLWSTTIVTDGPVWCVAIYTGNEARASLNTSIKETKTGLFDSEVNRMSKVLFAILVLAATVLSMLKRFSVLWLIYFLRFVLLLSSIIPISLRVNLDLAKAFYAYTIQHDALLESTVVRNSSIPEELGRIDFLLTDKTGTLTQNEMVFKKLHIGRIQFGTESLEEIEHHLKASFDYSAGAAGAAGAAVPKRRLEVWELLRRVLIGLSICHNVTPVKSTGGDEEITFQASSPDEIAIVKFTWSVGLQLVEREDHYLKISMPSGLSLIYDILYCFPFSSETKRMGIVACLRFSLQLEATPMASEVGRVFFFLKGAETVMVERLEQRGSHWLQEECDNFARIGLRTLIIAVRELSREELQVFKTKYHEAQTNMTQRAKRVRAAIESIEVDLTLLGLTGVEDKLSHAVPQTLEAFRHAGIRVWMLTGDKIETATCIAVAGGLKARQHSILTLSGQDFQSVSAAQDALESFIIGPTETVLVIDGPFLDLVTPCLADLFVRAACSAPSVICCRCSPTQKELIVRLIQRITGKRCAAVGDGGNDVSMIQAANCGIGIVGKEGKQASLAADFSIAHFSHLHRLLFWHGKNCYQRSAKLAQFVVHRGLIIATIQVIFSAIFFFIPLAIFQGWLTVGYATYYTMLPVFSLVLDIDLPEAVVFLFPELYDSRQMGRAMSNKTFFAWLWTSIYQGSVIMLGAILLFESDFTNIVSITFTSLILSELLNVASEITHWHGFMVIAQIVTVFIYFISMALLPNYFNLSFILSLTFWMKVGVITFISWSPLYVFKMFMKFVQPTRDSKLNY